jgi:hypothetical protein
MEGRALNIDSGRNFMRNGLKYIAYLQNKGIRYYRTDFDERSYITAFQFWYKKSEGSDTEIDVVQLDNWQLPRVHLYRGRVPKRVLEYISASPRTTSYRHRCRCRRYSSRRAEAVATAAIVGIWCGGYSSRIGCS